MKPFGHQLAKSVKTVNIANPSRIISAAIVWNQAARDADGNLVFASELIARCSAKPSFTQPRQRSIIPPP